MADAVHLADRSAMIEMNASCRPASKATEFAMFEWSTEPLIRDQRSYAAVFSDRDGGPSREQRPATSVWRRVQPPLKVPKHLLRQIPPPQIAVTSIPVRASYTSLDPWYVGLDGGAAAPPRFTPLAFYD